RSRRKRCRRARAARDRAPGVRPDVPTRRPVSNASGPGPAGARPRARGEDGGMRRFLVSVAAFALLGGLIATTAGANAAPRHAATPAASAKVNPSGGLDCHGFSPIQQRLAPPVVQCADIRGSADGEAFEDNGHYTGHDEPMNEYFSTTPGSGNAMQYRVTL